MVPIACEGRRSRTLLPEAATIITVALALAPRVGDGPDDHLARDRQEREGRAHDREQARTQVVGRAVDLRADRSVDCDRHLSPC